MAAKLTTAEQRPGALFTVIFAGHEIAAGVHVTETAGCPAAGTPKELPVQFVFVLAVLVQEKGVPRVVAGAVAVMLN